MKLIDLSVRDFIRDIDSASPAPGGGSASAVSGAMGAALVRMVGHLTIPKKKFQKLDDSVQKAFIEIHESVKSLQNRLVDLVDKDTDAFNAIMEAIRMPKETEQEKKRREKALESATIKAIDIPLSIAESAAEVMRKVDFVAQYGNRNAVSDVGVGLLMLHTALEGACLNVMINLSGLKDDAMKDDYEKRVGVLRKEARKTVENVLPSIEDAL